MLDPERFTAHRVELPDSGELVVGGRDPRFGSPGVFAKLLIRDGLHIVTEISSDAVQVNRTPVRGLVPLSHGDELALKKTLVVFNRFDERREPNLEAAILRDPDRDEPWLVYADWLEEQGDPLGRRISEARVPADDEHWLEGLGRASSRLEVTWKHGLIEKAVIREGPDRGHGGAWFLLARLLSLRAATFLRELVVDLLADYDRELPRTEIARRAQVLADALPALPALERLSLGYHLAPDDEAGPVVEATGPRFPRLKPGPIFTWAREGLIEVADLHDLVGAHLGDRFAASGMRVGITGHRLALGRIGWMQGADELCNLDLVGGRMMLRLQDDHTHVRLNGALDAQTHFLLPGDAIDVRPPEGEAFVKLRFLVD